MAFADDIVITFKDALGLESIIKSLENLGIEYNFNKQKTKFLCNS